MKEAEKRKLPIPGWWKNKPVVPKCLMWFLYSFWELDTCRQWDNGCPKCIPWSSIKQYAEYHEFDFDYLNDVITYMDHEYLRYSAKKHKEEMDKIERKGNKAFKRKK